MGTWACTAFLLLCLTPDSQQGGLPPISPGLGQGYGSPSRLGAGFRNGNGLGAQLGLPAQNGYGGGVAAGVKPQKTGFGHRHGGGPEAAAFPGAALQPGFGGGPKPQKPGLGGSVKPQKPAPAPQNGHGPGNGHGMQAPAFPGGRAQPGLSNGNGLGVQPGFGGGRKPQKPGLGNGNGMGAGALLRAGTPPGPASQNGYGPGYGGGMKPQKPGFGSRNGLGAQPAPTTRNGYGPGYGGDTKPQKPEPKNALVPLSLLLCATCPAVPVGGGRLGGPDGVREGIVGCQPTRQRFSKGTGPGWEPGPSLMRALSQVSGRSLGRGTKPPKPGYANGNGLAAQPGPCHRGVIPRLLPRPPTPAVPSEKVGGWGLKSQPPPAVQNGQFPGYQPPNGYRPGAEPGFGGGLRLQKVGFNYGTGALGAGLFPETRPPPAFPGLTGFRNGLPPQASPWPALRPWETGMKPGYRYAGVGSQPGDPEVKPGASSHLENAYEGEKEHMIHQCHCPRPPQLHIPSGPGAAGGGQLATGLPRSRSHPRFSRAHPRLSRTRGSLPPSPPPGPSLPHPPLPGLPAGLTAGPPPPSALAQAELPPLPALPLRPELLAPWGPLAHLALPELPPEACAPAPPRAALALQGLPRLPAPAPPPAHLPLPPLPEAAAAAAPLPVGARGRPPLLGEASPRPLPPLPARPAPCGPLAPPAPRAPWPRPALPPPPPYFFLWPPS
ncbi:PREDICTED: basic proline-rich protein-like [Dipodomys ordii]|uniref:Basic proline-rich protein-like n=1 Tax=Dipodomys ordii TaxID=10020 RepID=A0A1S3EQL5_DIPOR|nr:PREDICTED: basic proline-rich protein-like [Dipodomys ordii]